MNTAKITIGLLGLAFVASFLFRTSRSFRLVIGGIFGGILVWIFFPGIMFCLLLLALIGFVFYTALSGLRNQRISVKAGGKVLTYFRDEHPVEYWFYELLFFIFSILGLGWLVYALVYYPIFHLTYDIIDASY